MANGAHTPLRIVSLGGGSGLATLLRGLKRYTRIGAGPVEIVAVVAVSDDGGSSGRLRREFDVLPPGDIRNCMVALSEDEALLSRLFQYRFAGAGSLRGHSFGNLFLTAMSHLTGDFAQAVKLSSEVLAVAGRIYPCTAENIILEATLANGRKVTGETRISRSKTAIGRIDLRPRGPQPLPETLAAIAQADLITLGPGSLFTSMIPHFLVDGIPEALAASPALKVCFMNLMTQPGETTGLSAAEHVCALLRHCGSLKRPPVDLCVVNDRPFSRQALRKYQAQGALPVEADLHEIRRLGVRVLATDLLRLNGRRAQERIRHDSGALAAVAIELAQQGRRRKRKPA
jgi:uncharacterized cofD-like protein